MESREYLLLIGPNRRSERTIIERQWLLSADELSALREHGTQLREQLCLRLRALGVDAQETPKPNAQQLSGDGDSPAYALFAMLFTATALSLQRTAGHRVAESGFNPDRGGAGVWVWFEYEHDDVGLQASELAARLLADAEPALVFKEREGEAVRDLNTHFREFLDLARPLVLPLDTEALLQAAHRLDVPCVKLERDPYKGVKGEFRIRLNGLLQLGHCGRQQTVDGTFCITRNAGLMPLLRDRAAMRRRLDELQIPLPRTDVDTANCFMPKRAVRAAGRIGYPVVVKPGIRHRGAGVALDIRDEPSLRAAVEKAGRLGTQVQLEAMVNGDSVRVLVVGLHILAVIRDGKVLSLEQLHPSFGDTCLRIARHLDCGMVEVNIVAEDFSRPCGETGYAVVDVDCAPELDRLLPGESPVFGQAAEAFIRWLYPVPLEARIPIVGVTGTNGKTTTCRMIARIMQGAGHHTGMVCSDGFYRDEQFQATRADIGYGVHHHLFEDRQIDFAIFEEYFGRIARLGFAYSWCNVAVCTNVTPDHLGRIGVHDVGQMAELKRELPLRARDGVVLNADDERCLGMAQYIHPAKLCLASRSRGRQALEGLLDRPVCACVIEPIEGEDWIVLYDQGVRSAIAPVKGMPATFGGTAIHNVDNAMYAAAASYLAGAGPEQIRAGLSSFTMGFETAPGRLNIYDGLPFRVVMDYAHNLDGFDKICRFVDQQEVSGRKILMVSFSGDRRDAEILAAAAGLAGYFDHYVCRNFRKMRKREPHEIPALMKSGLLSAGVGEAAISVVEKFDEAVHFTLELAQPGDLVVLLVGSTEFQPVWALLQSMGEAA